MMTLQNSSNSILRLLFYMVYGVIYAGLLFHRSDQPLIYWYSGRYAAVLSLALLPFLLPTAFAALRKLYGAKTIVFGIIPAATLLLLVYIVAHMYFDYTREYRFDPYLQAPAQLLENQYEQARKNNSYRILALGGSTTKNDMLLPEDRYCAVLKRLLSERYPSVEIEVLNAGQNWWTTKHSLINYITYAEQWEPDLVIVMHAINDLGRSFSHPSFAIGEFNDRWTHHYAQARDAAHGITFEQYMIRRFMLGFTEIWFSVLRYREVDFPADWYRSHSQFRSNLSRIARYLRVDGPDLIFVTQPFMYKPEMPYAELKTLYGRHEFKQATGIWTEDIASTRSLARAMSAFNQTTKQIADSNGILLADAASQIPKNLEYFVDEVHYTPLGAKILAQIIADVIVNNGLVDDRQK
jgi:lysophospholipase L1-like esterase